MKQILLDCKIWPSLGSSRSGQWNRLATYALLNALAASGGARILGNQVAHEELIEIGTGKRANRVLRAADHCHRMRRNALTVNPFRLIPLSNLWSLQVKIVDLPVK